MWYWFADSLKAEKRGARINLYGFCFSLVLCDLGFGSGSVLMLVWRFRVLSNQKTYPIIQLQNKEEK